MSRRFPPCCDTGVKWLKDRVGRSALSPLTGQDWAALRAFFHLVELYGRADGPGRRATLQAMRAVVGAMQSHAATLAKEGIPHVLDWSHEAEIWNAIMTKEVHRDAEQGRIEAPPVG